MAKSDTWLATGRLSEKPVNEMVRRLIRLLGQVDRVGSF
jgi:hypothetical protein